MIGAGGDEVAIGQCRACGKAVSTIPAVCPHCGVARPTDVGEPTAQGVPATAESAAAGPIASPPVSVTATPVEPPPIRPRTAVDPAEARFTLTPGQFGIALAAVLMVVLLWIGLHTPRQATAPVAPAVISRATTPAPGPAPATAAAGPETTVASAPFDRAKFDSAYRAGKSIEGALDVGVSQKDFEGLVQAFATEVLIVQERINGPREQDLMARYSDVLATYEDSLRLWKEAVDQAARSGPPADRGGPPPIRVENDVVGVVQRHGLPTAQAADGSSVISRDAVSFLWTKARARFAEANRAAGVM